MSQQAVSLLTTASRRPVQKFQRAASLSAVDGALRRRVGSRGILVETKSVRDSQSVLSQLSQDFYKLAAVAAGPPADSLLLEQVLQLP